MAMRSSSCASHIKYRCEHVGVEEQIGRQIRTEKRGEKVGGAVIR